MSHRESLRPPDPPAAPRGMAHAHACLPSVGQAAWVGSPELTPGHLDHAMQGATAIMDKMLNSAQASTVQELLVKCVDKVLYQMRIK